MTLRTLLILTAALGAPTASYGETCIKRDGFLFCDRGTQGFSDDRGNLWTQDRNGRSRGVILDYDKAERDDGPSPIIVHE